MSTRLTSPDISSLFSLRPQATELTTWPQGKVHTLTSGPVHIQDTHPVHFPFSSDRNFCDAAHQGENSLPQEILVWSPLWPWTQRSPQFDSEKKALESTEQMYQPPCFLRPTQHRVAGLLYFSSPTVLYVRPLRVKGGRGEEKTFAWNSNVSKSALKNNKRGANRKRWVGWILCLSFVYLFIIVYVQVWN